MTTALRRVWATLRCSALHWSQDNSATTGASLAFYCAFSLAPLLLIVLTIAGWVVGQEAAYTQLKVQLTGLFGSTVAATLLKAMQESRGSEGGVAAILGVASLVIGATTVFAALQSALQLIWQSAKLVHSGIGGWIRARLLSFGVVLAVGFLLLVSLTLTTALAALRSAVRSEATWWVTLAATIDLAASVAIVTGMIALIYRFMPSRKLPWRPILGGALVTALLFHVGKWAIGMYLGHSTQPSAFGAAASFVALLLWLYYSAQIFLFGAEFTACLAGVKREDATETLRLGSGANVSNARTSR
ncbi:MAG: YihY/virulence factor BrkB family protein [Steroidobacteraceae bacterium]